MEPFRFNPDADYSKGPAYDLKSSLSFHKLNVVINAEGETFDVAVPDPFNGYRLPTIRSDAIANLWFSNPRQFYQNQVNFAVWCATTACGVSYANHLNHPHPLTGAVFNFHVYFQIRRILVELGVPLPTDQAFDAYNNPYDKKALERLCNEFGTTSKDWRQNTDKNHGLGSLFYPRTHREAEYNWGPGFTSFSGKLRVHIGSIEQQHPEAWTSFILDTSKGFTHPGIERVNESIRTYVYCLLSAQAQTRTPITDGSRGFDAQKQWLTLLEDSIGSPVDLPSSIARYENVLQKALSVVDYAYGVGLYMSPSNMTLRMGKAVGYNNLILIATASVKMGRNASINSISPPMSVAHKREEPQIERLPSPVSTPQKLPSRDSHEEEKTALIVGMVTVGIVVLLMTR